MFPSAGLTSRLIACVKQVVASSLFLTFSPLLGAKLMPESKNTLISSLYSTGDRLLAVGERGHVFHWSGQELIQEPFPHQQFLTGLAEKNGRRWVVGHDGLIALRQGDKWQLQRIQPELEAPLFGLNFQDDKTGFVVGAYGQALLTRDGGLSWKALNISEEQPHLYQAKTDLRGHWYVAGEFGTVAKISMDGDKVKLIDSGSKSTFFGIEVIEEDEWIAYGLRGRLIHGKPMSAGKIENPRKESLYASLQWREYVFFFGSDGTILRYRDGRLEDFSLVERVSIIDAAVHEGRLYLATDEGLRSLSASEVGL